MERKNDYGADGNRDIGWGGGVLGGADTHRINLEVYMVFYMGIFVNNSQLLT